MIIHHKGLELERWYKFSLEEQLANVGADIGRAINWKNKNDLDHSSKAFERALELLDLTLLDPKNRGPRRKELLRVREALVDYFIYDNEYSTSDILWQNYFYNFNYAAAIQKGR